MWLGLHRKYVCVPCRRVQKDYHESCAICHEPLTMVSYRWRPPKKNNDSAWKRIEKGNWLWEHPKAKASDEKVYWDGRKWRIWKKSGEGIVYK